MKHRFNQNDTIRVQLMDYKPHLFVVEQMQGKAIRLKPYDYEHHEVNTSAFYIPSSALLEVSSPDDILSYYVYKWFEDIADRNQLRKLGKFI